MAECKYCIDEICVNADSPMCADYCPVPNTAEVCKWEERTSLKVELSDGCKKCLHSTLCAEIENLKCRKEFVWYQAESGCPYYTGGVRVV